MSDAMRAALELIAGYECRVVSGDGYRGYPRSYHVVRAPGTANRGTFSDDNCPVCVARRALDGGPGI